MGRWMHLAIAVATSACLILGAADVFAQTCRDIQKKEVVVVYAAISSLTLIIQIAATSRLQMLGAALPVDTSTRIFR
jgi:hypothetical protein